MYKLFQEAQIGDKLIFLRTEQLSEVINKTPTSIQMFNTKSLKKKDKFGKYSGIDASNWYEDKFFADYYKKS